VLVQSRIYCTEFRPLNDSKPRVSAIVEVKIDKLHEDLHISHAANVETYPTRPSNTKLILLHETRWRVSVLSGKAFSFETSPQSEHVKLSISGGRSNPNSQNSIGCRALKRFEK
jgi:hypothetical protein